MNDFPKAANVPRGCGDTRVTGLYAESGRSRSGEEVEFFLLDPVEALPLGYSAETLANKARVWVDPRTGIAHLLSWVGIGKKRGYPHVWDIIEEIRMFGAARHISSQTPDLELLEPLRSCLILIHPRCKDVGWRARPPSADCLRAVPGHDLASLKGAGPLAQRQGPCLFQLKGMIPREDGTLLREGDGDIPPLSQRVVGSTRYLYTPTGETDEDCEPGRFIVLPLTGFCFYKGKQKKDRAKEEKLQAALQKAQTRLRETLFPTYTLGEAGVEAEDTEEDMDAEGLEAE